MSELHNTDRTHLAVHTAQLRTLARHLADPGDAEDFVQDTFVAALSEPERARSLRPWLRQVLRNTTRASVRRARRWTELQQLVPDVEPDAQIDERSAQAEIATVLREVLDGLEEPYRVVLRERFFGERTTIEIARQLGCPHGTVRWRLHEGLRRMKQELDRRFGARDHWYGAMVVLGGSTTGPAAPAQGAATMSNASILELVTVVALAGAGVACTYAVLETGPSEPSSAPTTSPVEVASAAESPAEPKGDRGEAGNTPQGSTARSPAAASGPSRPRMASATAPTTKPKDQAPAMTPLEYRRCGEEAAEAYNNSDEDDPESAKLLLEAARCFEGAGLVGLAIHANRRLITAHAEHAEHANDENQRLFWLVLDPELALETPAGQECVSPLREASSRAGDYIEAADCLYGAGFAGAALRYRELAAERPGPYDVATNERELARLAEAMAMVERVANRPDGEPVP